jgi:alpha-mannosidase
MRVALTPAPHVAEDDGVEHLHGAFAAERAGAYVLRYPTRTGALLRIDGDVVGAFDREHATVRADLGAGRHAFVLDVERRSLPTTGLPSGAGPRWSMLLALSSERARRDVVVEEASPERDAAAHAESDGARVAAVGHAHLDVAWLWTFEQTRRKAARTFATAARILADRPGFVFTQSQPQLYAWVQEDEPELFARVQALARAGRFDASGAAMWVEPDCNVPSGESLLRQLAFGIRYAEKELGAAPSVAWLPDSFGFANTLPTLLAHAGIPYFATTKLRWNDTTVFPYTRFWWEGPDGSRVLAALLVSYEGDVAHDRVALARERDEPLVVGYGDGGGGATDAMVVAGGPLVAWTTLGGWFARAAQDAAALPTVQSELYLEYHRGVLTTHHDVKAGNAALERALGDAELGLAWTVALRASPFFVDEARARLAHAWEIVLRNQFHDVLPGTSIGEVYEDVRTEYEHAGAIVAAVRDGVRTALPRSAPLQRAKPCVPRHDGGGALFENGFLRARVRDGVLAELRVRGGENLVREANVLTAYVDKPRKWEAWNVDRDYVQRTHPVEPLGSEIADDALFARYRIGRSFAAARFSLAENEPWLRVELAVDWRERRTLLRCENRLALGDARATFGSPYGTIDRPVTPETQAERARFEACGQRFARVEGLTVGAGAPASVAMLVLDTYGWSVGPDDGAGVRLGHSLLRGTSWPDPKADIGEQRIAYAFLPGTGIATGALEAAWRRFAAADDAPPPIFTCDDAAIQIVATKPADDGTGIIVRARECDGAARTARIVSAVRATGVSCVDALERPLPLDDAALDDGAIVAPFGPYALRTFRVALP